MRAGNKIIVMLLVAFFSAADIAQTYAFTEHLSVQADISEQISIFTEEDFLSFAESCYRQSYTEGKTFSLRQDLNLTGMEIPPVPLFCGVFEGNGHVIRGIEIQENGSDLGLFRYVEDTAVIRNLSIVGRISPTGVCENIGGVVGVNRGLIENCRFSGTITGRTAVGGIAGHNEADGRIVNCLNKASVTGTRMSGGIVGYQEGLIESSVNEGSVNTIPEHIAESEDTMSLDRGQLKENLSEEKVQDVGGIAGMSEGVIQNCRNLGTVGYERMGDYVGGIAGRQNGQILSCQNLGTVSGRRYIGGVAGQLEPYLNLLYEADTLDELEIQMDEFSEIGDQLSDTIENTADQTSDHLEEVERLMKEIRDITKEHKDDQKEKRDVFREESDDHLDAIQEVLDNLELDIGSYAARNAMSRISKNVERSKALLKELGSVQTSTPSNWDEIQLYNQLGQDFWIEEDYSLDLFSEHIGEATTEELLGSYGIVRELAGCAASILDDIEIVIFNGSADVEDDIQDLMDDLDSLRCESSSLMTLVRGYLDQLMDDLDVMDKDLSVRLDDIIDEGDDISDILKDGKDSFKTDKQQMDTVMDQLEQTLKDGKSRVKNQADKILDEEDFFDDISDDTWQELTDGMILDCKNSGVISAESESGGIAGSIGIKVLEDLKDRIAIDGKRSLNVWKEAKAVIAGCFNDGTVNARYNYAGGIVGNMNLGLLRACENYGIVKSEEGDYAGGIAGKSDHIIRSCYSMCEVRGEDYIGGIAGAVKEAYDNVAMTTFQNGSGTQYGSIAGCAEEDGVLTGNQYVDEGIGAVNGITYTEQAKGISYQELLEIPNLPKAFYQLKVSFWCDGELLDSIRCDYGDSLSAEQFPILTPKPGHYCQWEIKDIGCVKNNMQIDAVYHPYTTVISTAEEPLARMLAVGQFHPETTLTAHQADTVKGHVFGFRKVGYYQYEIKDRSDIQDENIFELRLLSDNYAEQAVIGLVEDGVIRPMDSRRDGKYLIFSGPSEGTIVVLEPAKLFVFVLIGVGMMLMGGGVFIKRRKLLKEVMANERVRKDSL